MTVSLTLREIRVAYPGPRRAAPAVDGVSLAIAPGEIVGLLGPSGCGKTSVLRAIAGFEPLVSGEIAIGRSVVSAAGVHWPPERRRVGLMFQEIALFPHLTAGENIAFGLQALDRAGRQVRVEMMLELVGLPGMGLRYGHELSGGQQQRIALARALAPSPDVLLLDEPFSSLDHDTRHRLGHEVRDIIQVSGQTAILVTHDEQEAHALCDRVGHMRAGRLTSWTGQATAPDDVVTAHPG